MAESKNTQSQDMQKQIQTELFGSNYIPGSSNLNESSELGALLKVNEILQEKLTQLTERQIKLQEVQQELKEGQQELKEGQQTIITTSDNIRTDISSFRKRTLAGISGLAGRGGSWLENCFPPNNAKAATSCLLYLIIFFIQLYIFLAFTWFNLCKTLINVSGSVSGNIPILGSFFRPITQSCMILFLLWISTFVLTLFAFNTMSGTDQIINVIYFIRQFISFIFTNVHGQILNMKQDLTLIADESGLSNDFQELVRTGTELSNQVGTKISYNIQDSVKTALTELPSNVARVASNVASSAAKEVSGIVSDMFGLGSNQGGGKRGKKSRKNTSRKRNRKTRKSSGGNKITEKFLDINREINNTLKETGLLINYLLSVMNLFHKLYLQDEYRENTNQLLNKYPIVFDFKNNTMPTIQMFYTTSNNILTKIKNENKFKINYIPLAKYIKLISSNMLIKGGRKKKTKRKNKKKTKRKNKKKTKRKNKKKKTKKTRKR